RSAPLVRSAFARSAFARSASLRCALRLTSGCYRGGELGEQSIEAAGALAPVEELPFDFGASFDLSATLGAAHVDNQIAFEREQIRRQLRHENAAVAQLLGATEGATVTSQG